jgi:hypothetical protein
MMYGPMTVNTFIIIYLGGYFGRTSRWLVGLENHRHLPELENSLIQKQYLFGFINLNISNWIFAFMDRNFNGLQKNLIIILAGKQIVMNVYEWLKNRYGVGKKVDKVTAMFKDKIE